MALAFRVATLLLACLFFLGLSRAADTHSPTAVSFGALVSRSSGALKVLWKRRRGGGSDSDSSSGSSSSSADYDDDEDDAGGGGSSDWYKCVREMNATVEERNTDSYGHYYPFGNGHYTSNEGGYTPEGSGTAPRWNNKSGAWVAMDEWDAAYSTLPSKLTMDAHLYQSYLGGASVPYPAGEVSPNGMQPETLIDLPYETDLGRRPASGICQIPNSTYAYKYKARFEWRRGSLVENLVEVTRSVPVYCCCAFHSLCGCDDFHRNSSFVPTMLEKLDVAMVLSHVGWGVFYNSTDICAIEVAGETIILVNGTLANGSTKADPTVERETTTVWTTTETVCLRGTGGADEVSGAQASVHAPSRRAFLVAWTATIAVGVGFGMCLVLL